MRRIRKHTPADSCAERREVAGKISPARSHLTRWFIPPVYSISREEDVQLFCIDIPRLRLIISLIGRDAPPLKSGQFATNWTSKPSGWVSGSDNRGAEGGKRGSMTEGINVSLLTVSTTSHPLRGNK